ncbi:MAG TPA: hypothetical protein DCM28_05005 [Phycisphaerales bacterium]|nr:hypothetical protein [Phycisphaerales bacterium]HCD32596.1 hypothetical protein [Phycisphaerales bacterium]|tara:strand:- start:47 stop:808 length:762 start_codon:yes stop_codon:yes gene_type:complete
MPYLYEMMVTIVADLVLLAIGVGIFFLWRMSQWARPRRLAKIGKQMEMEYLPESVRLPRKLNNNYPLTMTGTDRKMYNVLSGHYRDVQMHVFEYEFMSQGRRFRQTVFGFELRRHGVCRFASNPRDKQRDNPLKYWNGIKPIAVGKTKRAMKVFATAHRLVGLNEYGTGLQFNPKAVGYYARNTQMWTEGGSNWLLVYELNRVTPINQMSRAIWKAYQVCRMLQLNNNRVNVDELDENEKPGDDDTPSLSLAS